MITTMNFREDYDDYAYVNDTSKGGFLRPGKNGKNLVRGGGVGGGGGRSGDGGGKDGGGGSRRGGGDVQSPHWLSTTVLIHFILKVVFFRPQKKE